MEKGPVSIGIGNGSQSLLKIPGPVRPQAVSISGGDELTG